ncbi:hypothetical protein P7L53_10695 [Thermoleptolyngbya sichuanensis XZ-Cy5]|uniref:hypothetical protein n=1 Tax=Thermoleptolyngbya sichuanensis TaxID=2885951 RepID=UPI00240E7444|nr:hypothetical protein [Thermoleptolyngbya sichuanensis]MDG2616713.1 hypothetical protein [Thermoleptolyngbya sichuanensis XZ-Cy5]
MATGRDTGGAARSGAAVAGDAGAGALAMGAGVAAGAETAILSGAGAGGGVTCELGADAATFSAFCAAFSIGRGAVERA